MGYGGQIIYLDGNPVVSDRMCDWWFNLRADANSMVYVYS